jgi:hypothetical protein
VALFFTRTALHAEFSHRPLVPITRDWAHNIVNHTQPLLYRHLSLIDTPNTDIVITTHHSCLVFGRIRMSDFRPAVLRGLDGFICPYKENGGSLDSAIGIATGYGLYEKGSTSSPGRFKNFLFSTSSRPVLRPTQPLFQRVPRVLLFLG